MTEDFLQYVWKTRQFDQQQLATSEGEKIEVVSTGDHNIDAGPDFFNARIRIKEQLWAGSVEIHLRTTDWVRHGHQYDAAYQNVVLHVVYEHDTLLRSKSGSVIPTLVLQGRIQDDLFARYQQFLLNRQWVACAPQLRQVPGILASGWMARLLPERLEAKTLLIRQELELTGCDWEQAFYRILLRTFGMRVNAEPFAWLARTLPWHLLARKSDQLPVLEALLLGQAGLLPDEAPDAYCRELRATYESLCGLHRLQPQPGHNWKHSRMRPSNFPAIRIAQLAALLHKSPRLFGALREAHHLNRVYELLNAEPGGYWLTHYLPGVASASSRKRLGEQMLQLIVINVVIPFLFVWGELHDDDETRQRALNWLEQLPAESNSLIRNWAEGGITATTAAESQALIHLHRNYCTKKRCLNCHFGRYLLEAPDKIITVKQAS